MKRGDRVRLTDKVAQSLMRSPHRRINWYLRRGVVVRISTHRVAVLWDGNATLDLWPREAVVEVTPQERVRE